MGPQTAPETFPCPWKPLRVSRCRTLENGARGGRPGRGKPGRAKPHQWARDQGEPTPVEGAGHARARAPWCLEQGRRTTPQGGNPAKAPVWASKRQPDWAPANGGAAQTCKREARLVRAGEARLGGEKRKISVFVRLFFCFFFFFFFEIFL